jgi:hypothetical protein
MILDDTNSDRPHPGAALSVIHEMADMSFLESSFILLLTSQLNRHSVFIAFHIRITDCVSGRLADRSRYTSCVSRLRKYCTTLVTSTLCKAQRENRNKLYPIMTTIVRSPIYTGIVLAIMTTTTPRSPPQKKNLTSRHQWVWLWFSYIAMHLSMFTLCAQKWFLLEYPHRFYTGATSGGDPGGRYWCVVHRYSTHVWMPDASDYGSGFLSPDPGKDGGNHFQRLRKARFVEIITLASL